MVVGVRKIPHTGWSLTIHRSRAEKNRESSFQIALFFYISRSIHWDPISSVSRKIPHTVYSSDAAASSFPTRQNVLSRYLRCTRLFV